MPVVLPEAAVTEYPCHAVFPCPALVAVFPRTTSFHLKSVDEVLPASPVTFTVAVSSGIVGGAEPSAVIGRDAFSLGVSISRLISVTFLVASPQPDAFAVIVSGPAPAGSWAVQA